MIINTSPTAFKSATKKPITTAILSTKPSQARLLKQLREYKEQQNKLQESKQPEQTGFSLTTDN